MLTAILALFSVICLEQLRSLIFLLHEYAHERKVDSLPTPPSEWPAVLVQIPVYNEGWEVREAALAALRQQYPKDKLCIQVIDDSIQRWPELVAYLETEARATEVDFQYLNRPNRNGFKSGAGNFGMQAHTASLDPRCRFCMSAELSQTMCTGVHGRQHFGCTDSLDLPQQI